MLIRRAWQFEGSADAFTFGCISEEERVLDRIETGLGFDASDRWKEDREILNPEKDIFAVTLQMALSGGDWKCLLEDEVREILGRTFSESECEKIMDTVKTEGACHMDEDLPLLYLTVTRIGPANLQIV